MSNTILIRIPILQPDSKITADYLKELKVAIKSDGCTMATEKFQGCCIVHDLGYKFNIDPWGNSTDRAKTDATFRTCMRKKSIWGRVFAFWRYPTVRILGIFFDDPKVQPFETYYFN